MKIRKSAIKIGVIFSLLSYILLYVAIHNVLGQTLILQNYIAYFIFSIIIGLITAGFASSKSFLGLIVFTISYIIGFSLMIYSFMYDLTGWQDLVGLLQMMLTLLIGLVLGIVVQIVQHFYLKHKDT